MAKERVLPYLSKDALSTRDQQEAILSRGLSHCWNMDEFDVERAEHLLNDAVISIFDVELAAYRKDPRFVSGWIEHIMNESAFRVLKHAENNQWSDLIPLFQALHKTLVHHIKQLASRNTNKQETALPDGKKSLLASSESAPPLLIDTAAHIAAQRKSLLDSYREKFPDVKLADIHWAAKQTRREWTRWIGGEAKDGLKADRSFKYVLTSGKAPEAIMGKPRPTKYNA
jgi:hypothetical protein